MEIDARHLVPCRGDDRDDGVHARNRLRARVRTYPCVHATHETSRWNLTTPHVPSHTACLQAHVAHKIETRIHARAHSPSSTCLHARARMFMPGDMPMHRHRRHHRSSATVMLACWFQHHFSLNLRNLLRIVQLRLEKLSWVDGQGLHRLFPLTS